MIVVAGHLRVAASDRERLLLLSREAMVRARSTPGCHDFVVAADPLEPDRVHVYERWRDRATMLAFRGDGPDAEMLDLIVEVKVEELTVAR